MQPRRIPKDFKPRNETNSGSSTILTGTILQVQLQETSRTAWQNRQALDWMLAERVGVCHMFGNKAVLILPKTLHLVEHYL